MVKEVFDVLVLGILAIPTFLNVYCNHTKLLGFLNLNIRECSGNMGLKDIVMAFQWVKDNIHHFNGDPENITALGPSSGASIIHLLLCIPSTEGKPKSVKRPSPF